MGRGVGRLVVPNPAKSAVRLSAGEAAGLGGEILAVEGEDLLPAVVGGLDSVGRAVDREEGVAGVRVAVELVGLAVGLQRLFQLGDLGGRRVGVLLAKQAEQRAGQV